MEAMAAESIVAVDRELEGFLTNLQWPIKVSTRAGRGACSHGCCPHRCGSSVIMGEPDRECP